MFANNGIYFAVCLAFSKRRPSCNAGMELSYLASNSFKCKGRLESVWDTYREEFLDHTLHSKSKPASIMFFNIERPARQTRNVDGCYL